MTLIGVGGTGKTRLARRVAADLRRAYPDGAWFVDLTELHAPGQHPSDGGDPDTLAYLVGATLGLRKRSDGSQLRLLVDQLADRHTLLVLDNCEHLLPIPALFADALLRACPRLWILATSREPLSVDGEHLFSVPPLPVPDLLRTPSMADLVRCEAVALFVARAQTAVPGFAVTTDNQAAVVGICRRLDGLPLAIELAAARIRVLAPQQILDRLTDRFAMLSRGSRTAPERQQTLRACVDWSFELCDKPERMLWARLSVFSGVFEQDAIEGVCAHENQSPAELLEVTAGLVDRSILARDDHGSVVCYRMLETIRDYGDEILRADAELAVLRRRHRDWYHGLASRAHAEWISDRQPYWLARLGREHPNLRAAVEYCLTEPGEAETALRIALCLPVHYWWGRGLLSDCRRWLDRALAQSQVPTALRARALLLAGDLAFVHGDIDAATRLSALGADLARRLDDPDSMAHAAYTRGIGALVQNDLAAATGSFEHALAIMATLAEPNLDLHLRVLIALAVAAAMAGERARADGCCREMLSITVRLGSDFYHPSALWSSGVVTWLRGDLQEASAQVAESLRLKRASGLGDDFGTVLCLAVLAWIAAGQRRYERAATLLGIADALSAELGAPISTYRHLVGHHDECARQARAALGDAAFADAVGHGRGLPYDDALAYALSQRRTSAPQPSQDTATGLTRREREVADLLADGLSNKEIAAALVISQRTAESHVEHILTKLGFTSRTQVIAWVSAQRGLHDGT